MFCSEHGTLDYCPYCIEEDADNDKDKRIEELEQANERIAELHKALAETNRELSFVINEYNRTQCGSGVNHLDAETCHLNQILLNTPNSVKGE